MANKPLTVEIHITQNGIFVESKRVYMCESMDDAKKFFQDQTSVAKNIFKSNDNLDWMELQENHTGIIGQVHRAK